MRLTEKTLSALFLLLLFACAAPFAEPDAALAGTGTVRGQKSGTETVRPGQAGIEAAGNGAAEIGAEGPAPARLLPETRRYDQLSQAELSELARLERIYFNGIRDEALGMISAFFDTHTIIQTFTPQVRIIRQRKREQLNAVLRYLCGLRLEQEFISHYVDRLRDDAVDFAMDALLQKSRALGRRNP